MLQLAMIRRYFRIMFSGRAWQSSGWDRRIRTKSCAVHVHTASYTSFASHPFLYGSTCSFSSKERGATYVDRGS